MSKRSEPQNEEVSAVIEVVEAPAPPTFRAVDLARAAGMFPAMTAGPSLRRTTENPKAWLYQAAKLRGLGDEDQITQKQFDQRIAEISSVIVR
jgi:hypothetical protein